jgi:uncharacterized protein YbjT (DUF2867 family)
MPISHRAIAVAGSTGLVGSEAVRLAGLDPRFTRVLAPTRREVAFASPRVTGQVIDFEHLDRWEPPFALDTALCALGTTIRRAGSQAAFRRVDHDYPIAFAHRAKRLGVSTFLLVSAVGARADSGVFYNRVKGEVEDAIRAIGFERVVIARPSILLGDRAEVRPAELIGKWVSRFLPIRYRGIPATRVAAALLDRGWEAEPGIHILENAAIHRHRP